MELKKKITLRRVSLRGSYHHGGSLTWPRFRIYPLITVGVPGENILRTLNKRRTAGYIPVIERQTQSCEPAVEVLSNA